MSDKSLTRLKNSLQELENNVPIPAMKNRGFCLDVTSFSNLNLSEPSETAI